MSHNLFKERFRVPLFLREMANEVERMARCLNHVYGTGNVRVTPNVHGGLDIDSDGDQLGGIDLSIFALGIASLEGDTLVLNEGIITYGLVRTALAAKTIKLTGNPAFVIMMVNKANRSAAWMPDALAAIPANTPKQLYIPYYEFDLVEPSFYVLRRIHRLANGEIL